MPHSWVQALRMRCSSPGFWNMPQSLAPAMKQAGTSMRRPACACNSATQGGCVLQRYHCSPPWKPVRPNSAA